MNRRSIIFKRFSKVLIAAVLIASSWGATPTLPTVYAQGAAQAPYQLLAPIPCIEGQAGGISCPGGNGAVQDHVYFQQYIQYAVNLGIALATVTAVVMIVLGGFTYITSTIPGQKNDGLEKVKGALLGLVLILVSYLILQAIDPRFVAIPTTLVPQLTLNKTLTASSTTSFLDQLEQDSNNLQVLNDQGSQFKNQYLQILNDLAAASSTLASINDQKNYLLDQIIKISNENGDSSVNSRDDAESICLSEGFDDETLNSLCAQINQINNQVANINASSTLEISEGSMNAQIQRCLGITTVSSSIGYTNYGNGLSTADCQVAIAGIKSRYSTQLTNFGRPDLAQQVNDYAQFANTLTSIDGLVKTNMNKSPAVIAALKTVEDGISIVATPVSIGSTIVGIVAAPGSSATVNLTALNTAINSVVAGNQSKIAVQTAQQIQTQVNQALPNITDPNIKNQLVTQAVTIINALKSK